MFVVNFEPKKLAGELSEGMLFDLGYAITSRPYSQCRKRRCRTGHAQAER